VIAGYASWRIVFLVPAALALVDALVLGRLPESRPEASGLGPVAQVRRVLSQGWAVFLVLLAVAEGAAMLGFLTFLAPALQVRGVSSARAGLVVAVYGVAVFGALQLVKQVLRRTGASAVTMIAIGGSILVAAFLLAASGQGIPQLLGASLLIGVGYSFMHSTMQTWATEVVPGARGTATSLFVTAVFTGASVAHIQISPLASDHRFGRLFLTGALVAVPVTVVAAAAARARFQPMPESG
jgi:predicted MFS family arabinose efflux permease